MQWGATSRGGGLNPSWKACRRTGRLLYRPGLDMHSKHRANDNQFIIILIISRARSAERRNGYLGFRFY